MILLESNHLLPNRHPWSLLRAMLDITVAIDVPEDLPRQRLIERWRAIVSRRRRSKPRSKATTVLTGVMRWRIAILLTSFCDRDDDQK
jgi:pantothenate kinase